MEKFTVIRDTREKPTGGWYYDMNSQCNGTVIEKLDTGDYSLVGLEDFVCIERKQTVDEFAHNCIEKRWTNCMERMAQCTHSYLIFEFSWEDIDNYPASAKVPARIRKNLKVPAKYIRKVVNTARDRYGIHVLACDNLYKAEEVAYRILKKAYEISLRR